METPENPHEKGSMEWWMFESFLLFTYLERERKLTFKEATALINLFAVANQDNAAAAEQTRKN